MAELLDEQIAIYEERVKCETIELENVKSRLAEYKKVLRGLKCQRQRDTFTILCTPKMGVYNNSKIKEHTVGLFSSEDKAKEWIPHGGTSYVYTEDVTWTYTVISASPDEKEKRFEELDLNLNRFKPFPYEGCC